MSGVQACGCVFATCCFGKLSATDFVQCYREQFSEAALAAGLEQKIERLAHTATWRSTVHSDNNYITPEMQVSMFDRYFDSDTSAATCFVAHPATHFDTCFVK